MIQTLVTFIQLRNLCFSFLQKSKVNYESLYTINEILSSLSQDTENSSSKKWNECRFVTILNYESTDISNKKRQVVQVQIVNMDFDFINNKYRM